MRGLLTRVRRLGPQFCIVLASSWLVFSSFGTSVLLPPAANLQNLTTPAAITYVPPVISATAPDTALEIRGRPAVAHSNRGYELVRAAAPRVDCQTRPCLALSFDDGPNPQTTPTVLGTLEQKHATATFFVVGTHVGANRDIVRRMDRDGFEIGNHTWDHADLMRMTSAEVQSELLRTQTAIGAIGVYPPKLFRPPYGAVDPMIASSAGLQVALWNEDPRDWQATDATALARSVIAAARPGGVVDMHDTHQVTVDALPMIIDQLNAQGYRLVTVSELLHSRERLGQAPFYGFKAVQ